MELTFDIISLNEQWDAIFLILVQRNAAKSHLPSQKTRVFPFFRRNSPAENFPSPNFSAPVNNDVFDAAKHKKMEFEFVFKEIERQG